MWYNGVVIHSRISKDILINLYTQGRSMQDIARTLKCSVHKVSYWMEKYSISKRSRSDAMYTKYNPHGDPFQFRSPETIQEAVLFGMGIGLYWGEGTKASKSSIRLGNTDPELLQVFINFLTTFFAIKKSDLHFGLQVFTDINLAHALDFWSKKLKIQKHQFSRPTVTLSGSLGTYRRKSQYGVVTVMYHNIKMRNMLINLLPM